MTTRKRSTPRRRPAARPTRPRTRKSEEPPRDQPRHPALAPPESALPAPVEALDLPLSTPEPIFAARVPPAAPERPMPTSHRAIFFDVENTSRAQHIARMIEHLGIDRAGFRTEFVAVGNWRVIGHDTARLLARHGAHLVHSAPSVGVRDWSDLRIAVAAGAWLAGARPGDVVEIVSDDRAFDAVGDVAASLGITFRRLSYRALAGAPVEEIERRAPEPSHAERASAGGDASGRRRRGRRRGRRGVAPPPPAPVRIPPPAVPVSPAVEASDIGEPHTAPHDEIVGVVRDLMRAAPGRSVSIDAVANTLKSRGFSRPPGSPRLITRLRRIKEIEVNRSGLITLVDRADGVDGSEPRDIAEPRETAESEDISVVEADEAVADSDAPEPGNEKFPAPRPAEESAGARRRRRRGGRRRGGRGHRPAGVTP